MTFVDSDIDYSKEFTIFTDGSALFNAKYAPAGWGVYIPLSKTSISGSLCGTNNIAELTAIKTAFEYFESNYDKTFKPLLESIGKNTLFLVSDSEYALKAITGVNKAKANIDIINECKEHIFNIRKNLKVKIHFVHCISHTGETDFISTNNAIADALANKKAEEMNNKKKCKCVGNEEE